MTSGDAFDVVVAGGGLAGATLALAAARQERRVLVLDRDPEPGHLPYPELLWAGTWAALDTLDARDRLRRDAVRLEGVEVRAPGQAKPLLHVDAQDLRREDVDAWAVKSGPARRTLLRLAQESGDVEVRTATEVAGLSRRRGRVTGVVARTGDEETDVRAHLVVGADGARSVVRREMGLDFSPSRFPLEFIVRHVPRPHDLAPGTARAVLDPEGFRRDVVLAISVPARHDDVGVVVFARPGTYERLARRVDAPRAFADAVQRVCGGSDAAQALAEGFPDAFGHAQRPVGHAPAYFQEGAALAGDAAHPVSPVGGQGANMAILDAVALAQHALAATPRGQPPPARALADYEAHRRPANARGVRFSTLARRLFRTLWRVPALARPLPHLLRPLDLVPALRADWLRHESRASMARPPYSRTRER